MRFLLPILLLAATPVYAGAVDHSTMHHATPKLSKVLAKNPAVKAYVAANKTMHKYMDICYTGDADVDFVEGMIPHHQGAIDMAEVVLKYGKDEQLKALAQRIIVAQEAEIGMMKAWINGRRSLWRAENRDELPSVIAFKEAMSKMHKDMNIKFTGHADIDFARGMIPHHQGAVDMARILRKEGRDPMLLKFADDIIRSQSQEIAMMEEWLVARPNF